MEYCIIMCRSVTYAQRAKRVLEREGIRAGIGRAPQGLSPEGCSYAVRLDEKLLKTAVQCIRRNGIPMGRIYRMEGNSYSELSL